jgi:hypothetical protein
LTLEEYSELCLQGHPELPKMPPGEVQRHWTWYEGRTGMEHAVNIFKQIRESYNNLTRNEFDSAVMLDYGAGWGRFTRLALHTMPHCNVFACDADPKSVDLFNSLDFPMVCQKISPLPDRPEYESNTFDLILLYSILTHLPKSNADAIMRVLWHIIKPTGILVITIRPVSFWLHNPITKSERLFETHNNYGFSHESQGPHWGNTSISLGYIEKSWAQWSIARVEYVDDHQMAVYLRRNSVRVSGTATSMV